MTRPVEMTPTLPSASPMTCKTRARMFMEPWEWPWEWPWSSCPVFEFCCSSGVRSDKFVPESKPSWVKSKEPELGEMSPSIELPGKEALWRRVGERASAISWASWTRAARVATGWPYREVNSVCVGDCKPLSWSKDSSEEGPAMDSGCWVLLWVWVWEWACSVQDGEFENGKQDDQYLGIRTSLGYWMPSRRNRQ